VKVFVLVSRLFGDSQRSGGRVPPPGGPVSLPVVLVHPQQLTFTIVVWPHPDVQLPFRFEIRFWSISLLWSTIAPIVVTS